MKILLLNLYCFVQIKIASAMNLKNKDKTFTVLTVVEEGKLTIGRFQIKTCRVTFMAK